jgi:hypothetical protein
MLLNAVKMLPNVVQMQLIDDPTLLNAVPTQLINVPTLLNAVQMQLNHFLSLSKCCLSLSKANQILPR